MLRLAAAILAGGRARRMGGVHKGLLELDGRPMVARAQAALSTVTSEILLVAGEPAPYAHINDVRLVRDLSPGQGPLAGMQAAFLACDAEALLVVGCDLPFLDGKLLALLRDHAPAAQAVVPRVGGRPQALVARYARSALPAIEERLQRSELRLLALLEALDVAWLDEPALRAVDPALRSFTNVNTPEDLERVTSS